MWIITELKNKFLYFSVIITALLSGCKIAVLDPHGPIAAAEKHILLISTGLMLLIVIPVIFMALFFSWRYRAKNQATYTPNWSDSIKLEVMLWFLPIIIIVVLSIITWRSSHDLDPYRPLSSPNKPITIQAVALQWKWLFIYPEQHIATVNFLQFPVDVPVKLLITAEGPMNAIQIPQLVGQIYAMAGMQTRLFFLAHHLGDYIGRGVSFTGEGFANMVFNARASTIAEFNNWVHKTQSSPNKLTKLAYELLKIPNLTPSPVLYYGDVDVALFNNIINSYMGMSVHGHHEHEQKI